MTLVDSRSKKEPAQLHESLHVHKDGIDKDSTPREIYRAFAELEQSSHDVKWYHRLWQFLPLKASRDILIFNFRNAWGCCHKDSDFQTKSGCYKTWFIIIMFLKLCINLLAIYVALVSCAATVQIRSTETKLDAVRTILYGKLSI